MKKLILTAALVLGTIASYGQVTKESKPQKIYEDKETSFYIYEMYLDTDTILYALAQNGKYKYTVDLISLHFDSVSQIVEMAKYALESMKDGENYSSPKFNIYHLNNNSVMIYNAEYEEYFLFYKKSALKLLKHFDN
jgi:hypothetical protein